MGKNRKQASLTNVVQYDSNFNLSIGSSTSSSFNSSGSIIAASGFTGSLSGSVFGLGNTVSFSSSVSSRLTNIETKSASVDISISNINTITSSFAPRVSNLETKSASVDISITNINSFTASNANQSLNSKTGSYATTGSNTFFGTQTYSGSVYIANDLIVQGSSSIQYISASSVSIGTNIVQLNTANPSVRFAGLSVIDSGSIGGSGSFLYDSVQDEFIFVHRGNGTNVTSSHFIMGPETFDNLGNESYLTCNRLTKGTGKEHLVDSSIFDNGTTVCVNANLKVGADISISARNITLAGYPTSICYGNGQLIYDNGAGGLALNGQSGIQFLTCATASLNLSSAGYLGIGTTTPCRELHAKGEILFQSRNALPVNNSMYRFIPRSTENAFEFQLMADDASTEKTVWSVCRNAQTITSFNILNGNVGIGTCAPESKLHMYNANNPLSIKIQRTTVPVFLSDVQLAGTTAGAVWSHNLENTSNGSVSWGGFGNTVYAGSAIILQSDTGNSFITLHTAAAANTNPTERLRIGGSGTFGFNCSGVAARTMVVKGVSGCYIVAEFIEPAGVHSMFLYPNKNSTNHISSDYMSGGVYLPLSLSGRECTTDLVLGTNGRIGIGGGANCGILTVSDSGCTISGGDVRFGCQAKGIEVFNANSGTTDNVVGLWISTGPHKTGIASGRTNAAANWEVDLRFYTHPTTIGNLDNTYENMRLYGGGNLTINGTLAQTGGLSDINQKENLVKISNALNKIKCINGYNFDWKDGSPYNGDMLKIVSDAGLIAQEVEEIMPDIVRETKWDCHKTLNYNGVIALLVEGMKEQQCTINLLKSCIGIV